MKIKRLLIILLNFLLIGILIAAGINLYLSDFFEEHDLSYILPPTPVPNPEGPEFTDYEEPIGQLALNRDQPPSPPPPRTTLVQTGGIVYDRHNPASSGAHVIARGVPRYLAVGDNLPNAREKRYRLKEIREDKPDLEYILIFVDEKGKLCEAKYRRR
jgi:hypothetical protein